MIFNNTFLNVILVICCPQILFSQITLTSSNFPQGGKNFTRIYGVVNDGTFIDSAGPDKTYNYIDAYTWGQDSLKYLYASSTPFQAEHTGSTVSLYFPSDDTKVYWYFSSDSFAYWKSGVSIIGDFGMGLDTIHYNASTVGTDTLVSKDWTYGHTETEYSLFNLKLSDSVDYQMVANKWIDVDGWGSLVLPTYTWDSVLRVKTIEYKFDTTFYIGIPVEFRSETLYYYNYFAKNIRHPVLIAHTDSTDKIQYLEYLFIPPVVYGCMDTSAANYNPMANANDGSCYYCPVFTYSVSSDTTICRGNSVAISANGGATYNWSNGATTSSITVKPDSTTSYGVFISIQQLCWETENIVVTVPDTVNASFGTAQNFYYKHDTVQFVNTSLNSTSYLWTFDDSSSTNNTLSPQYTYTTLGIKNVTLVASNACCADTFSVNITIVDFPLNIPAISLPDYDLCIYPNPSDGSSIKLTYNLTDQTKVRLRIYDLLGRTFEILPLNEQKAGSYIYDLGAMNINLLSGIYLVEIFTDKNTVRKKLIVAE